MPYPQRVGRSLVTVPCVVALCVAGALGFVVLGMLVQFSGVLPLDGVLPWLALCGIGMVLLALSCFASRKRAALRKGCVFSGMAYLVEACAEYVGSCIYGWIHAASGNVASYSIECVSGDIAHNPVCGRVVFARAGASGEESFRARVGV